MELLAAEFGLSPSLPWPVLGARLAGAIVLCGLIGYERETRDRPAGLRTHILVGLASTVYCLIVLELIGRDYGQNDAVRLDPIRVVEAVTGGVAFLAAGMIVFTRGEVKGLTTGAGMWLAAAIGLAVGLGLWPLAVLVTLLSLIVTGLLHRFEKRYISNGDNSGD